MPVHSVVAGFRWHTVSAQRCYMAGCEEDVTPGHVICEAHVRMLPKPLARRIRMVYEPGQDLDNKAAEWDAIVYLGVREMVRRGPRMDEAR